MNNRFNNIFLQTVHNTRMAWIRFNGQHTAETPILDSWGMTRENEEFENYEDAPIWEGAPDEARFAITMKWSGCFDGTGGQTFRKRAKRKADTILVTYFNSKVDMKAHPLMNGYYPPSFCVFCWERDNPESDFEDGVF